jgi:hypothetical protein
MVARESLSTQLPVQGLGLVVQESFFTQLPTQGLGIVAIRGTCALLSA